jgi:Cu-Zn family superoxide dismutase
MHHIKATLVLAAALAAGPALAQEVTATASLKGTDGQDFGTVSFAETPAGVLITAELKGLPPGVHGFHLHEKGACTPDFKAAGGHFNPTGAEHGFMAEGGPHAGDMPNIHVPDSGSLTIEVLDPYISLKEGMEETLFDDDGTAVVIHAGADDYTSQPSGDAGDRIACGVVEKKM